MLSLGLDEAKKYIDLFKSIELKKTLTITCLSKMNKSSPEEDAINCLIVGTEQKIMYIIDSEAFTILASMECPSVPVFINASGIYDIEFRIMVGCRDGSLYSFKRGFKTPKVAIPLVSQIVGIEKSGKNVIIGCMNRYLYCYTTKGKKVWRLEMPSDILAMGAIDLKDKGIQGVIVSLSNNEVHIYRDKYIISKFKAQDAVIGIRFGRFGREDSNLIMTTKSKKMNK